MVYFSEHPSIPKLSLSVFSVTKILFSSSAVCYLHDRVERNYEPYWNQRNCKFCHKQNSHYEISIQLLLGTLSIDNEIHDDDVCNPRRIGSRLSISAGKTKVKQRVVFMRRRFLVIWQVALAMAFKNVRNLLLINHNDGFINDDEFVVLYDLYASKNPDFQYDS